MTGAVPVAAETKNSFGRDLLMEPWQQMDVIGMALDLS